MKLPFHRLLTVVAAAAAFAALASAQEPASSPTPKSEAAAAQTPGDPQKVTGAPDHRNKLGPFDQSLPEIMRASQVQGIIAELVIFGCPVLIVALVVFGRYRRAQLLHETLRVMVEKGAAIPPELLVPPKRPVNDFRRGILLISLGLGLIGLLSVHSGRGAWGFGLVVLFLGVGYLVVAKLGTKPPACSGPTLPL